MGARVALVLGCPGGRAAGERGEGGGEAARGRERFQGAWVLGCLLFFKTKEGDILISKHLQAPKHPLNSPLLRREMAGFL